MEAALEGLMREFGPYHREDSSLVFDDQDDTEQFFRFIYNVIDVNARPSDRTRDEGKNTREDQLFRSSRELGKLGRLILAFGNFRYLQARRAPIIFRSIADQWNFFEFLHSYVYWEGVRPAIPVPPAPRPRRPPTQQPPPPPPELILVPAAPPPQQVTLTDVTPVGTAHVPDPDV